MDESTETERGVKQKTWEWNEQTISWSMMKESNDERAVLLIHGFGANTNHWRKNQPALSELVPTYAIDLLGFGDSDKPRATLKNEKSQSEGVNYGFHIWSQQVAEFCKTVIGKPVVLVGNSIGGVVALRAALLMKEDCEEVILINCAQRLMDDKQLSLQPMWMRWARPLLKAMTGRRWLSRAIFKHAANPYIIQKILRIAYPSGKNVDKELIDFIYRPTQHNGADEAFRGFINLFDDDLAPELMNILETPVHLIWGEEDPWEPIEEAKRWSDTFKCVQSIEVIQNAGHCPHDESPEIVNQILKKIIKKELTQNGKN